MQTSVPPVTGPLNTPATPIDLLGYSRIVVLTDGASKAGSAKTAISLLRYRTQDVVAVLDSTEAGSTAHQVFNVGGDIPVVGSLAEIESPDAVFIGISPAGGKLPPEWRSLLLQAIAARLDIISGLHEFLIDNTELREAAERAGTRLIDVRRNRQQTVARGVTFPPNNLRIHAVGHDCSVGKMVVSVEIERELKRRSIDAKFLATGQTGIMISGEGVPVDCVVSDFVNGAVEQLVVANQEHDTLLIEGQGSLSHPSFSAVTMGLLHGCAPQGLVMCYEAGRETVKEMPHVKIKQLPELIKFYEAAANLRAPCKVIGIAANTKLLSAEQAELEVQRVSQLCGLPACDVYRQGAGTLVDAIETLRQEVIK